MYMWKLSVTRKELRREENSSEKAESRILVASSALISYTMTYPKILLNEYDHSI